MDALMNHINFFTLADRLIRARGRCASFLCLKGEKQATYANRLLLMVQLV